MAFWIEANWPAPEWIKAGTTTRQSGFSLPPYRSLNLAQHVGDKVESVEHNRTLLQSELHLPCAPLWLKQVHGKGVIESNEYSPDICADACYTRQHDVVCAILTADCLPLLLCDKNGTEVAAIHIGWRGFCQNIIDMALSRFDSSRSSILAWIGPHIHAENYAVGETVRLACLQAFPAAEPAFTCGRQGKWLASLETLVREQLISRGVSTIYSCDRCTFAEPTNFFSFRRATVTGRMASLIWIANRA